MSLGICADLLETSLLADATSTKILFTETDPYDLPGLVRHWFIFKSIFQSY